MISQHNVHNPLFKCLPLFLLVKMMNSYLSTTPEQNEEMIPCDNTEQDIVKREMLQQKHYFLFNELQTMSSELPLEYQQRLPYELLSSLACCLLNDTVFQIVNNLKDIQHMTEKSLFQKRMKIIEEFKTRRNDLQKKHKELLANKTITSEQAKTAEKELEKVLEDETRKLDMGLIMDLDQIVSEQQVTLERAGVPGFHVTNKPKEIQLQIHILNLITRLSMIPSLQVN